MTFDKLIFREAVADAGSGVPETPASDGQDPVPCPGRSEVFRENVLTVDFGGIGELTVRSGRGEVNWRRITRPVLDVLRAKLEACGFEAWRDAGPASGPDGAGWRLELFDGEKPVKRVGIHGVTPEQWTVFRSFLELCGALAEDRRQTIHFGSAG
ncbi:MAG: hypothetical protein IJT68_10905 [Lentisphaeria bacterium]|nr:hypothetical protein [Lentisphaeria bacterium]MBR3507065.1 hypothetical protein [Lentisphaeria bacterium]